MNPYIGKTLGSYQIIEQIGQGGMATVFKAYQPSMDRYVAVKILPSHFTQDKTFVARFTQEARVLAKLEHPHILPVYDYGEQEGVTYLVMRYIEAGTLHDLIAQQGRLSQREITRTMGQIGRALGYAHDQGVIHRDIKPSNVLIDPQGNAFLTDFGIAKIVAGTANFTGTGAVIGTPAYMAPEQGLGKPLDARCDIYALGVMLYEMVTGQVPFDAETPLAVMMMHVHDPLPLPRALRPDVPEVIERVILKALAKSPDDRFQTAVQMVETLERAVSGLPTDVSLPAIPGGPTAVFTAAAPPPVITPPPSAAAPPPSAAPPRTEVLNRSTPAPASAPPSAAQPRPTPAPTAPPPPAAPGTARRLFPWLLAGGGLIGLIILAALAAMAIGNIFSSDRNGETAQNTPAATSLFSTELTLDNQDSACSIEAGDWSACGSEDCDGVPYGEDFHYADPDCTDCRARCNFLIGQGGLYDVWAWWPRGKDRATDTPFTLVYGERETTIAVNQRAQGSAWVPLATVALAADAKFSVIVGSSGTGYANFDAVRLTPAAGWRSYMNHNLLHAVALQGEVVWGGGASGVVRWDTARETYTLFTTAEGLPDNWVNALLVDDENRLWAATAGGIAVFDGAAWTTFDEGDGIAPEWTNTLFADADGGMWAGMSYGDTPLAHYDGSTWRAAPPAPLPGDFPFPKILVNDAEAGLFVALDHQGLAHFDGEAWRLYTEEDGLPSTDITGLQIADEELYLTFWTGAARMDVESGDFTPLPQLDGVMLHTVYRDGDERLWFGGAGVFVYDPDDDAWTTFTADAHPALAGPVRAIAEADGVMWLATEREGLVRYDGASWQTWAVPETLHDNGVGAIIQDNAGGVWFMHNGAGLTRHIPEQGVWQTFGEADGAFDYPGFPGVNSAGEVWIGGGYGQLRWYDGSGWRVMEPEVLSGLTIYGVTFGPDDVMWVWGYEKLLRYDPRADTWTTFTAADHPLLARLNAIYAAPDGTLWGAGSEGLALYDGSSWSTATPGKTGAEVSGVSGVPDGSVWATSDGDLYRWSGSDWERYEWSGGWAMGVHGAADGAVWVWGDQLGRFNPAEGTWQMFTAADGLIPGNINAVWSTPEGVVWVGTGNGVSRYVP